MTLSIIKNHLLKKMSLETMRAYIAFVVLTPHFDAAATAHAAREGIREGIAVTGLA
jgi:hypothetical protein